MDQVQAESGEIKEQPAGAGRLTDIELVAEVLQKDRKATAEFVARCVDAVYGYVQWRLIPRTDLVDDVVQEVFLAAWENLVKYRGDSSLCNWLLGIARHKIEDHYRKSLREVRLDEEGVDFSVEVQDLGGLEEVFERRQAEQKIRNTLARIPEDHSFVLLWRYWERRSLREIAEQTGRTEKAIERLLARARVQFKRKWNDG
jgi:RNA polymerase sigma-70 factor, ECF subfamily